MTNDEQKTSPNVTPSPMVKKRYRADRDAIDRKRLPLAVKVFGVLCLVAGGATAVLLAITIVTMVLAFTSALMSKPPPQPWSSLWWKRCCTRR